jgi:hypothetical protein
MEPDQIDMMNEIELRSELRKIVKENTDLKQRLKAGQNETLVIGGEVVRMGNMYVDDELLTGVFVMCEKEEFTKLTGNLLHMNVQVTPQSQ